MADNERAPRLGSEEARTRPKHTREVKLPDRGASLLLQKPAIGTVIDWDVSENSSNREGFEATIGMLVTMCVEPKVGTPGYPGDITESDFRAEIEALSPEDWLALSGAVAELAGAKPELQEAAKRRFQDAAAEAVPVQAGAGPAPDGPGAR